MCRIYEDMILEKIPNSRYEILNNQYKNEQRNLTKEIKSFGSKSIWSIVSNSFDSIFLQRV